MNPYFVFSVIIMMVSTISVFIEVPIVSNYAYWFLLGAWFLLAGRGQ